MHFEASPPKKRELRFPFATAQQMQCTETKACTVQENKPKKKKKKKKNQKHKTRTKASLSFRFGSRATRSQITPRREKKHHRKPQNETFQKPSKTPGKKKTGKKTL